MDGEAEGHGGEEGVGVPYYVNKDLRARVDGRVLRQELGNGDLEITCLFR